MTSARPTRQTACLAARALRATTVVAGALLGLIVAPSAQAQPASPAPRAAAPAPSAAAQQQVSSTPLFAASFRDFDRQLQPLAKYKGQPMLVYFSYKALSSGTSCLHDVHQVAQK